MSSERRGRIRGAGKPDASARVRWLLAEKVSRTLSASPEYSEEDRVTRISVNAGPADALAWLRGQRSHPRFYWSGREGGAENAAAGTADLQTGDGPEDVEVLGKRLRAAGDPEVRYYGGGRFDPARGAEEGWEPFGAYRFALPRFELRVQTSGTTLSCNLVLPRDRERQEEILAQIEGMWIPSEGDDEPLPEPLDREDTPDRRGWENNVRYALSAFSEGRLGKVVLARRAGLGFAEDLDGISLLRKLRDATPGCFHFYVEPVPGTAFVGASPERLYKREGRFLTSEAVAGTRPRGASSDDDEILRDELLGSEKDRAEHGFVRIGIGEALGPLCEDLEVEEDVSEMKLASRRHLVSRVRARLREGVMDAEVLGALHPTPAVGGYPNRGALEDIRALEPFDRGWWAGPVGWVGSDAAEFAVGIRSGLVRGAGSRCSRGGHRRGVQARRGMGRDRAEDRRLHRGVRPWKPRALTASGRTW
ncbi:isochorismate synthase [Rubrobacter tropicus]|uniref:isochorismate synthase n=1 Tax=Rubrobacter tropicus TaxID=2653851 RepID=UPI00140DA5F1|nr:isochorismate synthase [Rubrobacter tropicus]